MTRAERLAFYSSTLFLFVAPFAASAGIRATCLIVSAMALAYGGAVRAAWRSAPRATLLLVAAWFLLSLLSLAWTIDLRRTLEELRAETLYGALAFLVFFTLATQERRWRAWCIAIVAGTLLTWVARGVQEGLGIPLWRHAPDGGVGPFSTHLVLIAPLLVALVWEAPWGLRRGAGVLALSLVVLAVMAWTTRDVWSTPNRIVWPALGVSFITIVFAARKAVGGVPATPALRRVILVGVIATAVAFAAAIALKSERFYHDDPNIAVSVERDLRPHLWTIALEQWRQAPVLGRGFGREILESVFLPETPKVLGHPSVHHAHNVFLNIALQLGTVGLALFAAMLVAIARDYKAMLSRENTAMLGIVGLAVLAGFLTKNLTDDFFHRHNAQVFWALNGMLLGFGARSRE